MKEKLLKLIAAKEARKAELLTKSRASENVEELRSINAELDTLNGELAELRDMVANCDAPAQRNGFNPLSVVGARGANVADGAVTLEQRIAFKNYIANGDMAQYRAAAGNSTSADNVGSVIPQNLINQIMEKLETVGTIYNLVTKTAYPVGQTIPKEATKPVATWVGHATSTSGEGNGSTAGKTTLDTSIVFAHFKLRCEVAMTEEVAQMSLSSFEALFVKNVSLAMLRAIEGAIVDGDGNGQPTGILANTPVTGQAIEVAKADKLSYALLCKAEAAIPVEYEAGAKWCMSKKTFMSFIGMVDSNGQPIARVNYGITGKPERYLLGREVVIHNPQTGSKLGNYADTVSADTLFAFIFNFEDYTLNNNYDLGIQHKIDWDNEDHRTKAVAAYDGKVIDKGSLVTLTKKSA